MKKYVWIFIIAFGTLGVVVTLLVYFKNSNKVIDNELENLKEIPTYEVPLPLQNEIELTKDNTWNKVEIELSPEQKKITVLLPDFYFNDNWLEFSKKIKQERDISINFQTIKNMSDYKSFVSISGYQNIDVFLVSSTWLDGLKSVSRKINLNETGVLKTYFVSLFENVVDQTGYTFLPFSVDVPITIVSKSPQLDTAKITLSKIFSYLVLYKKKNPLFMWTLLGLDEYDLKLYQKGWETFYRSAQIYSLILSGLIESNKISDMDKFLQFSNNSFNNHWSFLDFTKSYKKTSTQNENCIYFPGICLMSYGFADIKLGYLSDFTIWKKYFETNYSSEDMQIYEFPIYWKEYFVEWRWFLPHKFSQKEEAIRIFFEEFLKNGMNNSFDLVWDSFSAFNEQFDKKIVENKYSRIAFYRKFFVLHYWSLSYFTEFYNKDSVVKVFRTGALNDL